MAGLIRHPFGVGVGSFKIISGDEANHWLGSRNCSLLAHNIILEFISGMGVLGFMFIVWLINRSVDLVTQKVSKHLVWEGVFIGILVNFLFDATYFVPAMLWLWFMVLGLAQRDKESGMGWLSRFVVILLSLISVAAYFVNVVNRG